MPTEDYVESWWRGVGVGSVIILAVWIIFSLGSCTGSKVYDFPRESRRCVVQMDKIQACYPYQAEEGQVK